MHSLRIGFRSAIDARRWRRIRRSVSTTTTASALPAVVAGGILVAAAHTDPGLAGVWRRDDGQLVRIFHVGREVRSALLIPLEGAADRFELGGTGFVATMSGSDLDGWILAARTDEGSTECPQIPFRQWKAIRLSVDDDASRLTGRWMRSEWDSGDCVIEDHWQRIAYDRVAPKSGKEASAGTAIGGGLNRQR